ncbi:cysteine desulfurase [Tepiditoga spiralis]|uniref:cysteine desulfurase n=1 Tax=Tepiditoga spiralis TaxID=2108365 RepID=A0A7G1G4Z6_9BACT|nr:cysteine desulfurase family protein [Tepiditoga spiralis]BBE30094.1 cysteine desulfurase [Tepiditoga spiralis]
MIYFDNNATTQVDKEVADLIYKYMTERYANPNSIHEFGIESEDAVEESRNSIAKLFGVLPFEIYFTSCATESINWALRGVAKANEKYGKHIITSKIEHSATINTLKTLEKEGFEITYVNANKDGVISLEEIKKSLREDTILVSIMAANNETGTIQPIKEISNLIKEKSPKAYFHVDCVQIVGKMDFKLKDLNCDLASFSAHKFHGPKGVGILYKKERTRIFPIITGGSQERGMRGGTQNVPGIVGTALALKKAFENLIKMKKIEEIRNYIKSEMESMGAKIITPIDNSVPNTLAAFFPKTRGDVIVNALSDEGIYISTSAACSSKGVSGSRVLKELGYSETDSKAMLRISLSHTNTMEEAQYFLKKLKNVLNFLKF